MNTETETVLSGIRATGRMHLGNLMGALQHFATLDADPTKKCFFFVATHHTITTGMGPELAKSLRSSMIDIVLDFLAVGIDPNRSAIYSQASVPSLFELQWILGCLTRTSELESMVHLREKRKQLEEQGLPYNIGLLGYPVLMTADILGAKANLVPVGQDQHPHVELARDIARRFNLMFSTNLFPIPELLSGPGIRIPGLSKKAKMGKSDEDVNNTIYLHDPPGVVEKKFRKATIDPARRHRTDPGDPQQCHAYRFHELLSTGAEIARAQHGCTTGTIGCGDCKAAMAENVNALLAPIQARRAELLARGGEQLATEVLYEGGNRARARFDETLQQVQELTGLRRY